MPVSTLVVLSIFWLLPACQTTPRPDPEAAVPDTLEAGGLRFVTRTLAVEGTAVAAGDLDGDGHADVVGAGEPLTLFRGDGRGGFEAFARVPGGTQPDDFALTDLDADGDTDLVIANHDTDHLTILLGDGADTFAAAPNSPLRVPVRPHVHAVRAADLDGDGHVDLVVDDRQGEGLRVLRGIGGGQFEAAGLHVPAGGDPYVGMALGDLDGDGRLDVVTPNPAAVGVVRNLGGPGLAFAPPVALPATAPFGVALGDLNADGRLDVVAASGENSPLVEVFFGDGQGGFGVEAERFRLTAGAKKVVVGDFDGDGTDDAAVTSYRDAHVLLLLGRADGIRPVTLPGIGRPWGLAVADFNEDGRDDLIVSEDGRPNAVVFLSVD